MSHCQICGSSPKEEANLVLGAKSLDELDILLLGAGLVQDSKVGLALVECLGTFADTAGKAIMDLQRVLD